MKWVVKDCHVLDILELLGNACESAQWADEAPNVGLVKGTLNPVSQSSHEFTWVRMNSHMGIIKNPWERGVKSWVWVSVYTGSWIGEPSIPPWKRLWKCPMGWRGTECRWQKGTLNPVSQISHEFKWVRMSSNEFVWVLTWELYVRLKFVLRFARLNHLSIPLESLENICGKWLINSEFYCTTWLSRYCTHWQILGTCTPRVHIPGEIFVRFKYQWKSGLFSEVGG